MDIDTHMVEKNGLFLERYAVWDDFMNNENYGKSSSVISTKISYNLFASLAVAITILNIYVG